MSFRNIEFSVLVVDDDPFVLRTTSVILENMGFGNILITETADSALQIIKSASPSIGLILSDLNMPEMDGIELMRHFGDAGYTGDVVLVSGEDKQTLTMAENLAKSRGLSVIGSINKPVSKELLEDLIRNHIVPEGTQKRRNNENMVTPQMLSDAITARELEPWFQPKIDIASKQPVGVEVLARWPNSAMGPIFPDSFIPIAEENNLIDPLTFLIIDKAVKAEVLWRQQGIDLNLAINISTDSLDALDFPDRLEKLVSTAGGNLNSLEVEVTESRLMTDLTQSLDVLLRLRLKKILLSIDDFGTGHSNLTQLRDLPFDELKLDRSYIQAAANSERSATILASTVDMAKKLDMIIVAEGVETIEDWQRVEQLGCHQVQGYFCAKPMPGADLPNWIQSWPEQSEKLFS